MWIVELEKSGECMEFLSKKQAQEFLKQVKQFDKTHGIEGEVYRLYKED